MASCKECVHLQVCIERVTELYGRKVKSNSPIVNADPVLCPYFIDKSRFVELPCKVGETVYRICPVELGKGCSNCPWEYCECHDIGFQNDRQNSIREGKAKDLAWIIKRIPYFGKVYFTTPEKAEQAMKERDE